MSALDRLMLDHSSELTLLVDPQTLEIVHANASAARALGYEVGQLKGVAVTEIESALADVFYWEDVRAGRFQPISNQEGLLRCLDGELITTTKSVQAVQTEGRTLLLIQATRREAEHLAENVLAKTLSQLRATLESTSNGILVIDWQGSIDSMNHVFGSMWQLPDELLGSNDDARIFAYVSEQVQEAGLLRERLHAIVDAGATADVLHHHDGRVLEVNSLPQVLGEQIIGRVFSFQDITRHTLAEAALRESRDQMEERVRRRTADLYAANERLLLEKELQAQLFKKLGETQSQLLQSERMASIGQLAAGVAHEINNPVGFVHSNFGSLQTYVLGMLQLLAAYEQAESELSEPVREGIAQIKNQIDMAFLREDIMSLLSESADGLQRVTRIVRDLKNFSHVDQAELQFANIEEGIESTLRVVWNELKYKAEVVKEFGAIPSIQCFPFQLNQVFMNLLLNASQALEGKGTITIRTGFDAQEVWVEVSDTGKGIASEHLPRIFEPFFTTKPVGQGTGLGLSLSYGIVQKHNGSIEVVSEVGRGTTFKLRLPRLGSPEIACEVSSS
jgi:signal transduction histidine kinase